VSDKKMQQIKNSAAFLQKEIHAVNAHWWIDNNGVDIRLNPLTFSNKLLLIVTEIAEACEADRKKLMDDHLPHLDGKTVELADAILRIFDLAEGYDLDLATAIVEKMIYNTQRADHKIENRRAVGGKAY
jgi:NTP pyrophosphatase (non-canonical NTP hydrolase)